MAATATAKVPLGATTTNRKWYIDVNTGTVSDEWTGIFGVTEFKDALEGSLQDDSDFDNEGWKSETNTANKFGIEMKVKRAVQAALATAYDPGQEVLRACAEETGIANSVEVRWYEMEPGGPRIEAYKGFVAVSWSPDGGGMDALSTVTVKLAGQGKRTSIVHPTIG